MRHAGAATRVVRGVVRLSGICSFGFVIATASAQPQEVHGSGDTFATAGVKLAWAVERGATEARTQVVIGIALADGAYAAVSLVSIDPFSRERRPPVAALAHGARLEARIPRSRFADFPRTELHFYRDARQRDADEPVLVVYYLGVPDTTPEFADPGQLELYLAQRLGTNGR